MNRLEIDALIISASRKLSTECRASYFCKVLLGAALSYAAAMFPAAAAGKCPPGATASSDGYCVSSGRRYCGGGHSCDSGWVCINGGSMCMPEGGVDCGQGHYCNPGMTCGDGRCVVANNSSSAPSCGVGYHLFFPQGYGSRPECQPNQPGESGSGSGNQSTITGGSR